MRVLRKLFSGYVQVKSYIFGIHNWHGDVKVELLIPRDRFQKVFTGDMDLEELKRRQVKIFIPKIHTESEKEKKLEEERKELHKKRKEAHKAEKERRKHERAYKKHLRG